MKDTWHEESGRRNVCTREHEALLALPPETMAGRFLGQNQSLKIKVAVFRIRIRIGSGFNQVRGSVDPKICLFFIVNFFNFSPSEPWIWIRIGIPSKMLDPEH